MQCASLQGVLSCVGSVCWILCCVFPTRMCCTSSWCTTHVAIHGYLDVVTSLMHASSTQSQMAYYNRRTIPQALQLCVFHHIPTYHHIQREHDSDARDKTRPSPHLQVVWLRHTIPHLHVGTCTNCDAKEKAHTTRPHPSS